MIRISNQQLLKELKANARLTYVELAKKLGVSETAIR
ncbi:MAG: AsnC family transcriptional regulator, partial [Candidatus Odinarchaeia archaeon]